MEEEIGHVLPTTSLGERTLVRLCYLDIVQAVQRHDGASRPGRDASRCRLSKPCVSSSARRRRCRRGCSRRAWFQEVKAK